MKRRRLVVLGVVLVAGLAVGGALAVSLLGDDAPAEPTLPSGPSGAGGPESADGSWRIAPGEGVYVGYRVTEVFAGDVVRKTAVGRTGSVEGTLTVAGNRVTQARVTADLARLRSDSDRRDSYLRGRALESDRFPIATYSLTEPIVLDPPPTRGATRRTVAVGTLTLHGITRTVRLEVEARWDGPTISVIGTSPLAFADFGIEPPDTPFVKVDAIGAFELALTYVPGPPGS
ncbi:MAG: YceI family protein [Actinomycetota bacterium]